MLVKKPSKISYPKNEKSTKNKLMEKNGIIIKIRSSQYE